MYRSDDTTFVLSTLKPTTTNGVCNFPTGPAGTKIKASYTDSLFHIYIFAGENDVRMLAIEPLSIDSLTIPFGFRNILPTPSNYIYKLKIGQRITSVAFTRNNNSNMPFDLSANDSIYFGLAGMAYTGKHSNLDVIRLYRDKTCDVFERKARMVQSVYNRKSDSNHVYVYYLKLNK
jgi:hypothetical protein